MWRVMQWGCWLFAGIMALGAAWSVLLALVAPDEILGCRWSSGMFRFVECAPDGVLGGLREVGSNLWLVVLLPLFTVPAMFETDAGPDLILYFVVGMLAWGAVLVAGFSVLRWLYFTLRR